MVNRIFFSPSRCGADAVRMPDDAVPATVATYVGSKLFHYHLYAFTESVLSPQLVYVESFCIGLGRTSSKWNSLSMAIGFAK